MTDEIINRWQWQKSSLPHLVSTLGGPCDSYGAFLTRLDAAFAGLHTEAQLLQGHPSIPVKLTALEKPETRFVKKRIYLLSSTSPLL